MAVFPIISIPAVAIAALMPDTAPGKSIFVNFTACCAPILSPNPTAPIPPATLSKICEALGILPYKLFIEVDFKNENCSAIINQFCSELTNDISEIIKSLSEKYAK